MTPTNGQIIAEARRRAKEQNWRMDIEEYVIEVVREGWTPPEPVEPDVLAFREWAAKDWVERYPAEVDDVQRGKRDGCDIAKAFVAGARMAREQERERARKLAEFVEDQSRRLDGVGARAHDILAKYRGEA